MAVTSKENKSKYQNVFYLPWYATFVIALISFFTFFSLYKTQNNELDELYKKHNELLEEKNKTKLKKTKDVGSVIINLENNDTINMESALDILNEQYSNFINNLNLILTVVFFGFSLFAIIMPVFNYIHQRDVIKNFENRIIELQEVTENFENKIGKLEKKLTKVEEKANEPAKFG